MGWVIVIYSTCTSRVEPEENTRSNSRHVITSNTTNMESNNSVKGHRASCQL
jgi:hypothetical protein